MSCNGCRVLRKGCSESCVLRPCLQWIDGAESQGHATVFVAKFFGRAGLISFISAVPETQRPALFKSLLFEACGRTINPVNGAVGLLWSGEWEYCQEAVETVLRGGTLRPSSDFCWRKKRNIEFGSVHAADECDLDLCLTPRPADKKQRLMSPSMDSEGSVTTGGEVGVGPKLLNLFV